jgi:hypothetical protein
MGAGLVGGIGRTVDDRAVGRPPAHVAGTLIKIAVDDLDRVERKIDQPSADRGVRHAGRRVAKVVDLGCEFCPKLFGDVLDPRRDLPHLGCDHRKTAAVVAGARTLDQRVQRQHPQRAGDLLDFGDLARCRVADEVRTRNGVGDDLRELGAPALGCRSRFRQAHYRGDSVGV